MLAPCSPRDVDGRLVVVVSVVRKVRAVKLLPQIKIPGKVIQSSLDNESRQRVADALAAAGTS